MHHDAGEVILWILQAVFAERLGVGVDLECDAHQVLERAAEVGVARAENHVRPLEDLTVVRARDAHHLADDLQRERRSDRVNEVELFARMLLDHAVHDRAGLRAHVLLDASDFLWREALGDDGAQADVLRVVHRDHRAEELVQLDGEIGDVGATTGAEQVGVAAHVPDVVVLGQRPIARADGEVLEWDLREELDRGFAAQGRERGLANLAGGLPELGIGDVDGVQVHWGGLHGQMVPFSVQSPEIERRVP